MKAMVSASLKENILLPEYGLLFGDLKHEG